jgi:anaerobic ribonucleoside-triphosphate reductase activating protein
MLISADSMADAILSAPDIEGVTVSGGEPFLQAEALGAMLHRVRAERPALGVIVYTGYRYEELLAEPAAMPLLRETDLLIDGAYVRELDDGRGMRGSSNQRLLHLTDRYRDTPLPESRKTELRLEGGTMRMIGIPSEAAKEMLMLLRGCRP